MEMTILWFITSIVVALIFIRGEMNAIKLKDIATGVRNLRNHIDYREEAEDHRHFDIMKHLVILTKPVEEQVVDTIRKAHGEIIKEG